MRLRVPDRRFAPATSWPRRTRLHAALLALFAALSANAFADDKAAPLSCDQRVCSRDGKTVVRMVKPQATPVLAPPTIAAVAAGSPLELPGGGTIWATEDPQLAQPTFTVNANPLVPFADGRIADKVTFRSYGNYAAFATRIEVRVFRGTDTDLVTPLATLELPVANVGEVEWDGSLPAGLQLHEGDELAYAARIVAADGTFDETVPQRLQLVRPEDVKRQQQQLVSSAKGIDSALAPAELERMQQLQENYGQSSLRVQNIAVYGSTVRVRGQDIPRGLSVRIDGQAVPVDLERKFVAEYLLPIGRHELAVEVGSGGAMEQRTLRVEVTGRYRFLVALADLTLSRNSVGGAVVPVDGDDRYDGFLSEGRLAFYLKGKIRGRYLVTAQADTHEREVRQLFTGFLEPDARDVFRRLDPDQYYPVYGDDSTSYRDVDTQGQLYVRVDWDKNQALWGNFATGFTGTEYGQYVRSLYGAALNWRSHATTTLGLPRSTVRAFGSQAQTAPGHSEFLGTGGSLYYLHDADVLPGSDTVVLEVLDRTTGRVETRTHLRRDADYEIDELQGRLLLTRPLAQIILDNVPGIIRDAPLDGFESRLLVDYEYVPAGFDVDQLTMGLRGRTWLGEHVAIGGTYVDENRSGDDYSLKGLDLTLQAGRGTYLKLEQAHSEATSAPVFFSDDGGLSFTQRNPPLGTGRDGDARSIEARINLKELGWTANEWTAGAWWRHVDAGFSVARADYGLPIREVGFEFAGQINPALRLSGRYSDAKRGDNGIEQGQVLLEWRLDDDSLLSGELRRVTETRLGVSGTGTLAALRYGHRYGSSWDLYGIAQFTLDDDDGRYADNDRYTFGVKHLFGNLSSLGAEVSTGDRGDAATINAEYRRSPQHSLYAAYTYSTDTTTDPVLGARTPTGLTFGQRWRLSPQVNLFNESQFLKMRQESGVAHTFGMDFYPAPAWNLGFTLQKGELDGVLGVTDRRAVSVSGGYTSARATWSSKLEYRRDTGVVDRTQRVSTNRLLFKFNDDWRLAARLNFGDTDDALDPLGNARFVEGDLGFAYRPAKNDRWSLLGKYTYLYDIGSLGQDGLTDYDQRSRVLAIEGIFRLNPQWELAGKLAHRDGEARLLRDAGPWFDNTANFGSIQARFATQYKWDVLAEYRWLDTPDAESTRRGWLVGVDRHVGKNFRVGVGYNFTEFSDDLTDLDFDHRGLFLNVSGTY
jgi:hypothetical protein